MDRSSRGLKEVPEEIFDKPYLKKLYLFRNAITELPSSMIYVNVLYLSSSFCLCTEMKEFKDLAIFDINYNQLKTLPSEIVELTSLTEFCLAGNSITKFPSGTTLHNNNANV